MNDKSWLRFFSYFNPQKFPEYLNQCGIAVSRTYHSISEKIKHQICVLFKIKFHMDALEHQARFWQQEHDSALADIDELNEEIQQCWHRQQVTDALINELNMQVKLCQHKQSSAEFALAKIKRDSDLQRQEHEKEISALKQELNYQKTLAALDSETIAFLAQAQTDLFFEGKLQALRGWPLISIILPVWNQAETICETIQSLLDQTYPYWELLIIDDGSTDNTKQKITRFLQDKRIDYYLKEHGGTDEARNIGLAKCAGELIAYLDADKVWARHVLSVVANAFLCDAKCQAVYFAAVRQNFADNQKWVYFPEKLIHESQDDTSGIDINCFVHHRSLYDQLGKYSLDLRRLSGNDLTSLYQKQTKVKRLSLLGTHSRVAQL